MPELNALNIATIELIIENINEVAEEINNELYNTWKYRELEAGAQYGSRTFSPMCFYDCYALESDIRRLCEYMNNSEEMIEAKDTFHTHIIKLVGQNMKCYEFYDAEALYKDLAYMVMLAVKAMEEWDIKLINTNE